MKKSEIKGTTFPETGYYCTCNYDGTESTKHTTHRMRLVDVDHDQACIDCGHYARFAKAGTMTVYAKTGVKGIDDKINTRGRSYEKDYE